LVHERPRRWIDAGVGSGTAERFRATAEWGHRNLFSRGFQGALSSRVAFDGGGRFLLSHTELPLLEPWLLRTRTRAVLTPSYERSSSFRKVSSVSSWYTPFRNGWVLATRVRAGAIRPTGIAASFSPGVVVDSAVARVPVGDRFRMGGVNSVRGFDENAIPPFG